MNTKEILLEEMTLEEIKMEIEKKLNSNKIPSPELFTTFSKKLNELDEAQGTLFTISVLNSNNEVVDEIEAKACNIGLALLKAEKEFLAKNENYTLTDSGMLIGSNTRDLCVEIDGTDKCENFQLVIG